MIVPGNMAPKPTLPVVGIACDKGFLTLHVHKYMMNREIGFGRRLLQILEENNVPFEHMPSGMDSISVIMREKHCTNGILEKMVEEIKSNLVVDSVVVEKNQAILMLVGRGMTKSVGVATRATAAFSKSGINIKMINQGSSEVSIMFGVEEQDAKAAVVALYNEFFE